LDRLGITSAALARLRRRIRVDVRLRAYAVTATVARLSAPERHPFLRRRATRWLAGLYAAFPAAGWKVTEDSRGIPHALHGRVAAKDVATLAKRPGVEAVTVTSIPGYRLRRTRAAQRTWFCVRGSVAIQIEGQRAGLQSTEDRFMLVRATSAADARRRLRRLWREYATPYVNPFGELVRWQLERVTDVYDILEDELDPDGAEVYSKLSNRRMRAEFVWQGVRRTSMGRNHGPGRVTSRRQPVSTT
jgi:hypothetical protein